MDSADLSADERATLTLAVMDGLRIQSLLDPSGETLGLLEVIMKLVVTPWDPKRAGAAGNSLPPAR